MEKVLLYGYKCEDCGRVFENSTDYYIHRDYSNCKNRKFYYTCSICKGRGVYGGEQCRDCGGTGRKIDRVAFHNRHL